MKNATCSVGQDLKKHPCYCSTFCTASTLKKFSNLKQSEDEALILKVNISEDTLKTSGIKDFRDRIYKKMNKSQKTA